MCRKNWNTVLQLRIHIIQSKDHSFNTWLESVSKQLLAPASVRHREASCQALWVPGLIASTHPVCGVIFRYTLLNTAWKNYCGAWSCNPDEKISLSIILARIVLGSSIETLFLAFCFTPCRAKVVSITGSYLAPIPSIPVVLWDVLRDLCHHLPATVRRQQPVVERHHAAHVLWLTIMSSSQFSGLGNSNQHQTRPLQPYLLIIQGVFYRVSLQPPQ